MTIGQYFKFLSGPRWQSEAIKWPPDLFALCASVLQKSGGYICAVSDWPPPGERSGAAWRWRAQRIGKQWRAQCLYGRCPTEVRRWWNQVIQQSHLGLEELSPPRGLGLCQTLVQLCGCADEACAGIGLPEQEDAFDREVLNVFVDQFRKRQTISTVCKTVSHNVLCVLPKMHTPQKGITIRSLSHHLALCPSGEASPTWVRFWSRFREGIQQRLSLLIVPWPEIVSRRQFNKVARKGLLRNMPSGYGFFSYDGRGGGPFPLDRFERILRASQAQSDEVQGVVLPELAVLDTDLPEIWKRLAMVLPGAFLIAGVGSAPLKKECYSKNEVACWFSSPRKGVPVPTSQKKHHRWLLDSSQLQQYGLTHRLGGQLLWENIGLGTRELKFFPLTGSLTLCSLICEDLARPDPIGDLIRAVGPNLVIALLMDGPQLAHRWAARYAAVLADDPGSSVLSLTSIGMARLSTPLGKPESRVVALWKDASRGPFEIELPQGADALVLNLSLDRTEEWSADGRTDGGAAGRWVLQTVSPIAAP